MLNVKEGVSRGVKRRKKSGSGRSDARDRSMIHLLHRASQRASEIFAIETRDFDLTPRQYAVLTTVAQHEGLSQTDLVRLTTYAVSLSDDGRELLNSIKPYARRADRTVLSCLGDEDGKMAAEILSRLLRKTGNGESAEY